jgi:hypothetical protein
MVAIAQAERGPEAADPKEARQTRGNDRELLIEIIEKVDEGRTRRPIQRNAELLGLVVQA